MPHLRRILILLAALLSLSLAGCLSPTTSVEPGDGPAVTGEPSGSLEPDPLDPEVTEGDPPYDTEPTEEPSDAAPASFTEKVVYADGLEVEVTKVKNGRFTAKDVEYTEEVKKGDPYTVFTIRVTNKSPKTVDLVGSVRVAYGPDGEEAESTYVLEEAEDMSGKLIKGKARSAGFVYLVPTKFYDNVVLEFSADFEHESAVFSGSIK